MAQANPLVHLELRKADLPRACAFYTALFGWQAESVDAGTGRYVTLRLGDRIEGGVVEDETEHPFWLPYVEVADVAEATDRARLLGASVRLTPREGPVGWRSVLARHRPSTIRCLMAKLELDDTQTAEIALDETWRQLAPVVDRAKELKEEVARHPEKAADPEVDNYVRWLDTFNQELAAIQTIHGAGQRLPAEDLRAARSTAEKLLGAVIEAAPNLATPPQQRFVAEQSSGTAEE